VQLGDPLIVDHGDANLRLGIARIGNDRADNRRHHLVIERDVLLLVVDMNVDHAVC